MVRFFLFFTFVFTVPAQAESLCEYYKRELPSFYEIICSGKNSSRPAGASSTFSAGFNVNAASLPTQPSSYGLEGIGSWLRNRPSVFGTQFAIVKGFSKIGTGISTAGSNIFYGNDVIQRAYGDPEIDSFSPHEDQKSKYPNLNVGTSVQLKQFQNKSQIQLGLSIRHNATTATWGGGPALLYRSSRFSVGAGFTRERISNYISPITFTSFSASTRLWIFEFEYIQLRNFGGPNLPPTHIFTGAFGIKKVLLTAAIRKIYFEQAGWITQPHYAIQWSVVKNVSIGALYNYFPGTVSAAAQFYL